MGSKQEDLKTTSKSPCEGRCGIEWVGVRCQSGQNRSRKMGEEMLCSATTSYKTSSTPCLSPSFIYSFLPFASNVFLYFVLCIVLMLKLQPTISQVMNCLEPKSLVFSTSFQSTMRPTFVSLSTSIQTH
jgi:hypothetical protein